MNGLLFVIDQLGSNLSALSNENERLRAENARLAAMVAEAQGEFVLADDHA